MFVRYRYNETGTVHQPVAGKESGPAKLSEKSSTMGDDHSIISPPISSPMITLELLTSSLHNDQSNFQLPILISMLKVKTMETRQDDALGF